MKSENYVYAIHLLDAILAPLQKSFAEQAFDNFTDFAESMGVHKCLRIEKGILI